MHLNFSTYTWLSVTLEFFKRDNFLWIHVVGHLLLSLLVCSSDMLISPSRDTSASTLQSAHLFIYFNRPRVMLSLQLGPFQHYVTWAQWLVVFYFCVWQWCSSTGSSEDKVSEMPWPRGTGRGTHHVLDLVYFPALWSAILPSVSLNSVHSRSKKTWIFCSSNWTTLLMLKVRKLKLSK